MNCVVCDKYMGEAEFLGKRKTCSDKCRKAKSRNEAKEKLNKEEVNDHNQVQ